jgi:hypothetical protein
MTKDEARAILVHAEAKFLGRDKDLLVVNANERSLTHKFAQYMQGFLGDSLDVDCEYNRSGADPKKIDAIKDIVGCTQATDSQRAVTVYPDIVVHKRGILGPNAIVIEAKKDHEEGRDREKLRELKRSYEYEHAVFLKFDTEGKDISWDFID